MMSQFRPVISGQCAYDYMGALSLSYIKCVYGGYDWYDDWLNGRFPGEYRNIVYSENGTINSFGNAARPITYYIYGYAVAPYVNGNTVDVLYNNLNNSKRAQMLQAIATAKNAGVVPLAYEGGIEVYHTYTDPGLDTVIEDMLNFWFSNSGGLFCYYSLAGNNGSGIYSDLTRQDSAVWPKVRAARYISGLD
jgi:hypothetical protein